MSSQDSAAVAYAGSGKDNDAQSQRHEAHEAQDWHSSNNPTDTDTPPDVKSPDSDALPPKAPPLQKRRRVTRACDECRRKKIKCDGKQPCTHCTVYSYGMVI